MSNNVYFGNSVADKVSVNINNALENLVLTARSTTEADGVVTVINAPAVQAPTGPNLGKGIFGTGGAQKNKVEVQFDTLEAGSQIYTVETTDLAGRDLYFYVFDGTLVGQDETGRANGISITNDT
jgi:hypothetical protein